MNVAGLVLFALVAGASCENFFPTFPTPTFLWADNEYFTSKSVEYLESVQMDALTDLVAKLTNPNARVFQADLLNYVSQAAVAPEVLIIYIEPKAELSHAAYSFLQTSVTSAVSSIIVPNLYQSSYSSASESLSSVLGNERDTIVVDDSRPDAVSFSQLSQHLTDNSGIFSNGVVDVAVVYLPSDSSKAAVFVNIQEQIKERSAGSFVAVYTGEAGFTAETRRVVSRRELEAHDRHVRVNTPSTLATYWPKEVWEGMFVFFILGILLIVGMWCTFTVQTPTKWEVLKAHQE